MSRKTRQVPRRVDRAFSGTLRHLSRQAWRGVRSSRAWCSYFSVPKNRSMTPLVRGLRNAGPLFLAAVRR